jgi:hypothetical protein
MGGAVQRLLSTAKSSEPSACLLAKKIIDNPNMRIIDVKLPVKTKHSYFLGHQVAS